MQVHDVPLLINGDYQTVTYTVGSGVGVFYGFQPGTGDGLRASNSTTFVAPGGSFTVSRPVYVVAETKNDTADLRVGEATASGSAGTGSTTFTYDAQGRLTDSSSPGSVISGITYDAQGRVSGYTENGTARTLTYDPSTGLLTGVS